MQFAECVEQCNLWGSLGSRQDVALITFVRKCPRKSLIGQFATMMYLRYRHSAVVVALAKMRPIRVAFSNKFCSAKLLSSGFPG